jgi:hypothetical protein
MQREVGQAVLSRPVVGRRDERASDAAPGRAFRDHEFADVAIPFAGEVPARPDADDAHDRGCVHRHEHRRVTRC